MSWDRKWPTAKLEERITDLEVRMSRTYDEDLADALQREIDDIVDEIDLRDDTEEVDDTPSLPAPWWESQ